MVEDETFEPTTAQIKPLVAVKADAIEIPGKALIIASAVLYAIGLLSVNTYLYSLGVTDHSIIRTHYIFAGLIAVLPIFFGHLAGAVGFGLRDRLRPWLQKARWLGALKSPRLKGALVEPVGWICIFAPFWLLSDSLCKMVDPSREVGIPAMVECVLLMVVAAFLSCLPKMFVAAWQEQSVFLKKSALFAILGSLIFVAIPVYLILFVGVVYSKLPSQFGGGRPQPVRMIFAPSARDSVEALGISLGSRGESTSSISLLYDSGDFVVLQAQDIAVLKLERNAVQGMQILKKLR